MAFSSTTSSSTSLTPTFHAYDVALQLARAVRPVISLVARHDPSLADQLRRAVTSVPLNVAEGNRRIGKDRPHLFRVALGSAAEVQACLDVAEALGYLAREAVQPALAPADRVQRLLRGLTR
ncbi:MAG: four helix bundle protein [Anaeromyxobacteraceae bacterium]